VHQVGFIYKKYSYLVNKFSPIANYFQNFPLHLKITTEWRMVLLHRVG